MANTSECGFDVEGSPWIWEEDKKFELGLVDYPEGCSDRWDKVAAKVGTKSAAEVERHYVLLLEDVAAIEAGSIEEPSYADKDRPKCSNPEKKQIGAQRKTARPWTEDEHRLFLHGLEKYGKGDWKSISRYVVHTRNPTQVASHAQKYFERQEKEDQTKKRKSIFDNSNVDSSVLASKLVFASPEANAMTTPKANNEEKGVLLEGGATGSMERDLKTASKTQATE